MNLAIIIIVVPVLVAVGGFIYGLLSHPMYQEPDEDIIEEEEESGVVFEVFSDLCRFFKREGEITYAADVNFMQKKAEEGEVDIDTAALFLDYASQTVKESVRYSDERNASYRNAVDKAFRIAAGRLLDAMDGEE